MVSSQQNRRGRLPRRLSFETLEDRCVPAVYALTDLGALGAVGSFVADINEAGHVVGTSINADGKTRGFLWRDGVMTELGTLGGEYSYGGGLNDVGQAVGISRFSPESSAYDAFLWENGVMTALGVPSPQGTGAADINNAGQVVGAWYDGHHWRAYLWEDGVLIEPFAGHAADINDAGQIVGEWESTRAYPVAAIWEPGLGVRELGVFPGGIFSGAAALNDVGQVVGYSESFDGQHAVLWENGQMIDLGYGAAADINNAGQIVGYFQRGTIWNNGVMTDLNELVPAGSGLTIQNANGINDAGQIIAYAVDAQGASHAVLLTPLPANTPVLTIGDVSVTEGNTGTKNAVFTVNLSTASSELVTVAFSTATGGASVSDYQPLSGTLAFAPGETSKSIAVVVSGDRVGEPNETFFVNLTSATHAIITDNQGVGTIIDDEPRINISDVAKLEGKQGQTTLFVFTVTLSAAYDQPVTVSFATANGTARANKDYVAQTGTLTFAAGETTKTITIQVNGNNKREADRAFFLDLVGASSNSLINKKRGMGTILNDD